MSERPLGGSLRRYPELDTWIRIETDGTVTLRTGKVELGQGLVAAIARIGAEELDVSLERVRVETADTARGPDEFLTAGSMSLQQSGSAMRQVAAEARQVLLELAAKRLGAPVSALQVEDGSVRARGSERRTSYAELMGGRRFERKVTGEAVPKAPGSYRIVGVRAPRPDLLAKLTGCAFLHDLTLPGMLHGRVLRPPSYGAELLGVDLDSVRSLRGVVEVVRDGAFLGVIAEREEQAERAREHLAASSRWREHATLPAGRIEEMLRGAPTQSFPVIDGTPEDRPVPPLVDPRGASRTLAASYFRPYHMHASIGPSAALAQIQDGALTVWSHSQGVGLLRLALAEALGLEADAIRVIHAPGPGCYGHNGADDAALDAALLARSVPGRAVRLQWTREDEHAWEPYGPATLVDMRASLDDAGRVIAWSHEVRSNTHLGRPAPQGDRSSFVADWHRAEARPPPAPRARMEPHAGIHRNADPIYAFPDKRVVKHLVETTPLRVSSTRGLGSYANVFAIESFMDELAAAAGLDPLAFRLAQLDDPRARSAIEAAAEHAGWRCAGGDGRGQGLGFSRYKNSQTWAAVVVDVVVDAATGVIRLERAVIAADAGQVVDPDGLANQLEGGFVQAASWTLVEQVRFDETRITSRDWDSYPILTFPQVPEIETVLLDRPGEPWLGAGEAAQGPTPGAIANAVAHACGARLRRIPFTPERVLTAMRNG